MNIQIDCKNNVTEDELRYIYHNLKKIIEKYKSSYEYKKQQVPKKYSWEKYDQWHYEMSGIGGIGVRIGRKVIVTGSNNTLYFKFKELTDKEKI